MSIREKTIEELLALVIMQEREITSLKKKLRQVKQYIEVYEEYIQGENDNGY